MNDLIDEFESFTGSRYRSNPGESDMTSFVRHLAEEKSLLEYEPVDWLALANHLGLPEDEVGAIMEGAAAWIPEEPTPPSEQEPADWPDELPNWKSIQENPMVRYTKGTEIEDCACEETCNCDPCPCDECDECGYCLCCDICSEEDEEEDDNGDDEDGEDSEGEEE